MKMYCTIEFREVENPEIAEIVAKSLSPDNLRNIETNIDTDNISIRISTEKITSLIATVDDYLMNAKIAEDILRDIKNK
ncbi:conserved hypothetical protein [Methanosalsum zhilinae DSM 4017]|uniref:KEOPS complex Pcc1-like subunit n=1 Tax=Methanosalsum zhilinae (strain DSM 4017 / NBRC 107636 / OCM 62 / WeN5) TaxID=679901 RepID=F7XNQ5_METZD|nr:KEOPS complex subunit Pcc1 [Methanosalsum zhilinae]AEH61256.1 conserved hypothetical protein [Methanosalsum zhilinae DSM 4017]